MASGNGNYTFNPTGGMDHFTQHPWFSPGNSLAGLMGHPRHHHDQNITTGYH
jgi:hypothetical protein